MNTQYMKVHKSYDQAARYGQHEVGGAAVYQQSCPCTLTWSNTSISWISRFAPECKLYSKLRQPVE